MTAEERRAAIIEKLYQQYVDDEIGTEQEMAEAAYEAGRSSMQEEAAAVEAYAKATTERKKWARTIKHGRLQQPSAPSSLSLDIKKLRKDLAVAEKKRKALELRKHEAERKYNAAESEVERLKAEIYELENK